ncbi:hypothetical protein VV869_23345 [Photobacterium sp. MCCC 1A19761]|uniref:hypothetical protein n=1 Tax=Photobacterium sp. MCCC 1A19761 TaxID=3115000 RepID=UPI00307F81AD
MISWFKENPYTVGSVSDLRQLQRDIRYCRPRKYSDVSVALPALQHEENDYVAQRIGAYYFMCGCTHGKIAAGISLILATLYFVLQGYTVAQVPLWLTAGAIAGVSVGVKVLAQVHAKRALAHYLDQLIAHVESR